MKTTPPVHIRTNWVLLGSGTKQLQLLLRERAFLILTGPVTGATTDSEGQALSKLRPPHKSHLKGFSKFFPSSISLSFSISPKFIFFCAHSWTETRYYPNIFKGLSWLLAEQQETLPSTAVLGRLGSVEVSLELALIKEKHRVNCHKVMWQWLW